MPAFPVLLIIIVSNFIDNSESINSVHLMFDYLPLHVDDGINVTGRHVLEGLKREKDLKK